MSRKIRPEIDVVILLQKHYAYKSFYEGSAKAPNAALPPNLDPLVQASTLRSRFSCRLAFGAFAEPSL
ncbi:hypothetical protein HY604_03275 [Candidatus Peregrinibacteria bacterium]|nr:hypothetical protein [Candidatus Peregrinibacteria bacterium]